MTDALYLEDSTETEFDATVERAVDDRVVLDRTRFYPTGGGQPHDTGVLRAGDREWRVTDVRKRDTVYHVVDGDPPEPGTAVRGVVDADRRRAHARYHTAQHVLSAVLLAAFDAPTTGNQLYSDRARLDCEHERFTAADLEAIEAAVNDVLDAAHPVEWYTLDRETAERELDPVRTRLDLLPDSVTAVRVVEIGGGDVDRTACAGTHVGNTAAVGTVRVTGRETAGRGEERVRFELD
ncbi:alanyl-tRNA editing protein [Halobacterium yunchengense]|uniref:alanyl-tRNA editing protein n=1 Tax=Halobacterium yunchengense TaxID=3108497 RepID=UPI00300B97AE